MSRLALCQWILRDSLPLKERLCLDLLCHQMELSVNMLEKSHQGVWSKQRIWRVLGPRYRAMVSRIHDRMQTWRVERHFKPLIQRERTALLQARQKYGPLYAEPKDSPLVSVVIAAWNRGPLLVERTLPSILNQSYQNFEIVVVGDHCTDQTETLVNQLNDPRIQFYNLPQRGNYPKDPRARWYVAGSIPLNRAVELARGEWLAHLDDDEVFTPNHIEVLLRYGQAHNLEMTFGKIRRERTPGVWREGKGPGISPTSKSGPLSVRLLRAYVYRTFPLDVNAWRIGWSSTRHVLWRMKQAGVRDGFVDRVVTIAPLRPGQTHEGCRAEDRPDHQILGKGEFNK